MGKIINLILLALIIAGCGDAGSGLYDGDGGEDGDDTDTGVGGDADSDGDSDGDGDSDDGLIVQIVAPGDGDSFLTSEVVDFECRASFVAGQILSTASYEWNIEPAGMTLLGQSVSSQLPSGEQAITCTASDSASGKQGKETISVVVGAAIVEIIDPDNGARFPEADWGSAQSEPIDFTAIGGSIASGSSGNYSWDVGPASGLLGQSVQTSLPVGSHEVKVVFTDTAENTAVDIINVQILTLEEWNECLASTEVCNGIDDNCNGEVDEGQISCGVGECYAVVDMCENGQDNICIPGTPEPESCNNRDDDCDGTVDDHGTDINSLCENSEEVCVDGDCENFEYAPECTGCPCDACEDDFDLCCDFSGAGIICIDQDEDEDCPV